MSSIFSKIFVEERNTSGGLCVSCVSCLSCVSFSRFLSAKRICSPRAEVSALLTLLDLLSFVFHNFHGSLCSPQVLRLRFLRHPAFGGRRSAGTVREVEPSGQEVQFAYHVWFVYTHYKQSSYLFSYKHAGYPHHHRSAILFVVWRRKLSTVI